MTDETLCPADQLNEALAAMGGDEQAALRAIDRLCAAFPADPRLAFLRGSLLASIRRYDDARGEMSRAVQLAPDFAIARFQLGFLELTSGLADAAEATWGPLVSLPGDHPLRLFAQGLKHLIHDEFASCVALLRAGIETNTENPPLNRDMELILTTLSADGLAPDADDPISPTHLLLRRYAKPVKH
jgi:hypothetical protein